MADPTAGPLRFRIIDSTDPKLSDGLPLMPFFQLHHARYQIYFELVSTDGLAARRERLARIERAKAARAAATLDSVAIGEQQSEVEHAFVDNGSKTGIFKERRWRGGGLAIEYALDPRGATAAELAVTYWGSDKGSRFEILVDGVSLGVEIQDGKGKNEFVEKRYPLPGKLLNDSKTRRLTVRFVGNGGHVGNIYDVRLMKPQIP